MSESKVQKVVNTCVIGFGTYDFIII